MKRILARDLAAHLAGRGPRADAELQDTVARILEDVRRRGDEALLEYARRFDAPELARLEVGEEEYAAAELPKEHLAAIRTALHRVLAFHEEQLERLFGGWRQTEPGSPNREWRNSQGTAGQRVRPVDRAGIYVPGGRAAYPSSVLMNVSPAIVLGVPCAITTPARPDGTLHPVVLASIGMLQGVRVFKVGGAAAIAALAFGTESVPRVDVIAGPGNAYVNEAKRQVWGRVGVDGYAGPSEVCVWIDSSSNPRYAAADLLTQIEHAPDNVAYLVSEDEAALSAILSEAEGLIRTAERREILEASWRNGLAILARDGAEAADAVNQIAPEHLSVATRDPHRSAEAVRNAGCILLGEHSPESAGDFTVGPSHTLPTGGAARFASPVSVATFLKLQSVVELDRRELQELTPVIEAFAEMEGFPMHGYGAAVRRG
jgi:histidinol dehydrogenase